MANRNVSLLVAVGIIVVLSGIVAWGVMREEARISSDIPMVKQDSAPHQEKEFVVTDSMAGWQTYTDPAYGFEFKYPSGYQADVSMYPESAIRKNLDISVRKTGDPTEAADCDGACCSCALRVQVLPGFLEKEEEGDFGTPKEWADSMNKDPSVAVSKTLFSGKEAYSQGPNGIFVFFPAGAAFDRYQFKLNGSPVSLEILKTLIFSR